MSGSRLLPCRLTSERYFAGRPDVINHCWRTLEFWGKAMRRREFITAIAGSAATWPLAARAQQPSKVVRVGFLRQAGPDAKHFDAFRDGLREAGYSEGHNLIIEQRYAAGAYERLFGLATELLSSNVDVIVVDGTAAATDVRFWHKADMPVALRNVRFWG